MDNPGIIHFQRRRREGSNFSLEFIFQDVRARLSGQFDFKVVVAGHTSNGVFNRILNILQAWRHQGQVNHVTGDIHYVTYLLQKRRTILTILDCGFMSEPNGAKRRLLKWLWLDLPVKKSKYITTISEASKSDILSHTSCAPEKIHVIPVAVDEIYQPCPKPFDSECPVLLQIGTAPNKNIERLAEALNGISCRLIIVGVIPDSTLRTLEQNQISFENRINLSQEEMYKCYCDCDIVTFVSTFEGFGMPIVEANCVERPVITGSTTSMPEVGGDAACYVDAFSVSNIREGMLRIISDTAYRQELVEKGRENRARFSNEHIANMYATVYRKVLNSL